MSTNRFLWLFVTTIAISIGAPLAYGQREIHHVPPLINPDGYNPDVFQPFIEPGTFEPDFQFFAPAEVDRLNTEIEPSIGWFATYDRCYIYVTRPEDEPSYVDGDFGWGNRFDLGYMTEEDHGWLISFLHIDGPNNSRILEVERINVVQGEDLINFPPGGIVLRGDGDGATDPDDAATPGFPVRDRNDPVTNQRDYRLRQSVNVADLSSFELNKTFRIDPLHYGSIIEPFFGFRYFNFNDYFTRERYSRFDENGLLVYTTDVFAFPPPPIIDDIPIEQYDTVRAHFDNNMFGGQIGMRWFKQKSRWNLSGEVRAFAAQNFQSFTLSTSSERTIYDGGLPDSDVQSVLYHVTENNGHSSEFVFGTEVRAEAAYDVTKYIQLRGGMQFLNFARGIGRGSILSRNDQDVLMVGATFGVAVNR